MSHKKSPPEDLTLLISQHTLLWDLDTSCQVFSNEEMDTLIETNTLEHPNTATFHPTDDIPTQLYTNHDFPTDLTGLVLNEQSNISESPRYEFHQLLGSGGMGEVYRVFDHRLKRFLALKVLHPTLSHHPIIVELFLKEAQSTGLLQHPGIIPVHDLGYLPDGRCFFTMQEITGSNFGSIIELVHQNGQPTDIRETHQGWSIYRLLQVFLRICETLAYAHELGIIHRDIKPANFMLGEHGEVLVLDWGIAKILPHGEGYFQFASKIRPQPGSIVGTPQYISPEQAKGEGDQVTQSSDVFSLGCLLYDILMGLPYRKGAPSEILAMVQCDQPSLPLLSYVDEELRSIFEQCVALNPQDRFASAIELHQALQQWMDEEAQRQKAFRWIEQAQNAHHQIQQLHQEMHLLDKEIRQLSQEIPKWASLDEKETLWKKEDRQAQASLQAQLLESDCIEWLNSALHYDPDLQPAHQTLADIYFEKFLRSINDADTAKAEVYEKLIRIHDRGRHIAYLNTQGLLRIESTQPCTLELFEYSLVQRRYQPIFLRKIHSHTPQQLPLGRYLLQVKVAEHTLNYPLYFTREHAQITVRIPDTLNIIHNDIFVPAAMAIFGNRNEAKSPEKMVFVEDFYIQKHPVTNREYLIFLNDLAQKGFLEEAIQCAPRNTGVKHTREILYGYDEDTHSFCLKPDEQGDMWDLDWPVLLISANNAKRYAQWYSEKTGTQWTLPSNQQWEKAARGVDGRALPWGEYFEPTWACVRGSDPNIVLPAPVEKHPLDVSPYGVCGMAGNIQDFCLNPDTPDQVYSKGGAWCHHTEYIHMSTERPFSWDTRLEVTGFRLIHY